ncbi:serine hydrolase domain-containing protein [Silicimonas sp. MF1-12-2]|uniref:serine hydrolase domain-containing protein n=1 Tax=Silicimonas sp. MF1-12-2 TaxID=3384793 RepID=UPI0039B64AAC
MKFRGMERLFGLDRGPALTVTALVSATVLAASPLSAQALTACAGELGTPAAVEDALDEVLRLVLNADGMGAPGAVLSVRGPGWHYAKAAGTADPDSGALLACDMPFQIGSNTKMITAAVLLQLQEEGKLSVDDLLAAHLPELAAGLPNGDAMTLRHLAQHTSGVFSYTDNAPDGTAGLMEGDINDPEALRRHLEPDEMMAFTLEHGQPNFAPGAEGAWSYSNTGFAILGMVIEKIEGLPIDKSFETRIFGPLEMKRTYMWNGVPRPAFGLPRSYLAAPFDYETTDWNMSQGWAAGAVVSTVEDMHVFIEALVGGRLFQSEDTLSEMMTTVKTTHPALFGYGLGLALKGDNLWGHGGQTLGFESEVAAITDRDMSFVAWGTSSSNALGFGAFLIAEALRKSGVLPD